MLTKMLWVLAGLATLALMSVGVVMAVAPDLIAAAPVSSTIGYQGRLTDAAGNPLDGQYTMIFRIYDAEAGGSELWSSAPQVVTVDGGLFNAALDVDPSAFNGQALWLEMTVEGEVLSPRQALLPAPYALSLRAGADIQGDPADAAGAVLNIGMNGFWPNGSTVASSAPATGTAVRAEAAGGTGLSASSQGSYGIEGSSVSGWGGYFTSQQGYGLRVDSGGTDHYDHGAYITSQGGYAVYAQSANNMGVRGEAGDITGIPSPLGPIGVVGLGQNRGMVGGSVSGTGVYATSNTNYGVWGQSATYRGVTGRTDRADDNYGLYTPDNLFAKNYNLTGAIMQVVQNTGSDPLEPGDVAVFTGVDANFGSKVNAASALGGMPMVQVGRASATNGSAVAGVVYSGFNIDALLDDDAEAAQANAEINLPGPIPPGGYLLLVTHGAVQVKAKALNSSIQPGDLLVAAGETNGVARAAEKTIAGGGNEPGAVFAKALEATDGKKEMIYVYVTLQ